MKYIRIISICLFAIGVFTNNQGHALQNSVPAVTASASATSVVNIPRSACTGVLISPTWILTIAHCIDPWSDRSIPASRDVTITTNQPAVRFVSGTQAVSINVDRVVRVDGASTLTNSLGLMHLVRSAPAWSNPIPLYVGNLPPNTERMEIFGYSGRVLSGGYVNISRKDWNDIGKFWVLRLQANPSSIQRGDSGGPVLITPGGPKQLVGINWNTGGGTGGSVASVFDIDEGGHTNPVGCLIDRIINGTHNQLPEGLYEIKAMHSEKCLDVSRSSLTDGADIIQYQCGNTTNQNWRLRTSSGGYYEIVALHSGKCLDVAGSNIHDQADIIQYQCLHTTNQQWRIKEGPSGVYELQARHSCKCLDVAQSSQANGANIIQYKCANTTSQRWIFTPVSSSTRYELQFLNVECLDALNPRDELMIIIDGRHVWNNPRDIDNNGTLGSPRNISLAGLNYGVRADSRVSIELEEVDARHNDPLGNGHVDIAQIIRNGQLGRRLELDINNVRSSHYVIDYSVVEIRD